MKHKLGEIAVEGLGILLCLGFAFALASAIPLFDDERLREMAAGAKEEAREIVDGIETFQLNPEQRKELQSLFVKSQARYLANRDFIIFTLLCLGSVAVGLLGVILLLFARTMRLKRRIEQKEGAKRTAEADGGGQGGGQPS